MQIDELVFEKLPPHLQAIFVKLHNPGKAEVLAGFPNTGSSKAGGKSGSNANPMSWDEANQSRERVGHTDNGGSAARFFYCGKATKRDRDEGNTHSTVKPTAVMRWLCRLITPPGGVILDPFAGSGSTLKAAVLEGFQYVGIEREAEYVAIARGRVAAVQPCLAL